MMDKQPILTHFAEIFSEKYTEYNDKNLDETFDVLYKRFMEFFSI